MTGAWAAKGSMACVGASGVDVGVDVDVDAGAIEDSCVRWYFAFLTILLFSFGIACTAKCKVTVGAMLLCLAAPKLYAVACQTDQPYKS